MTEEELLLEDRLAKIRATIGQYGEEAFALSFSGGKDSTVVSVLLDMALPGNRIPRVYCDTGIELNLVRQWVKDLAAKDDRIQIIQPRMPIKATLEAVGYPVKSKAYSEALEQYQKHGKTLRVRRFLGEVEGNRLGRFKCPEALRYQFTPGFGLKVSDKCCQELKERPLKTWAKAHGVSIQITGIMASEGGRRETAQCLAHRNGKVEFFNPLAPMSQEWLHWFIQAHNVPLCPLYGPPYNIGRTGCKGCPFKIKLQDELDMMAELLPGEAKQCELIWAPVYAEYRRIGYRLRQDNNVPGQITLEEVLRHAETQGRG